jgi:hypothetical protein
MALTQALKPQVFARRDAYSFFATAKESFLWEQRPAAIAA